MKRTATEKFHKLLEGFSTAVLITHGHETYFRARPMAIARVEENCDLWFITNDGSAKVDEIEAESRVQVICQNGCTSCLAIVGRASLSQDRAKIREMWKASYQVWFPGGPDDVNIALIRVAGEHGEYWDNTGANRLIYAYQAIRAVVTGTTPQVKEGVQHGHVELQGSRLINDR